MTQDSATPDATSDHPDGLDAHADAGPDRVHDEGPEGLEGLDEVPVSEHVARFTQVHDALRARLDGQPDQRQQPDQVPGSGDGPRAGSAR